MAQLVSDRHPLHDQVVELRQASLRSAAVFLAAAAFGLLCLGAADQENIGAPRIWLVAGLVAASAAAAWLLADRLYHLAATTLLVGAVTAVLTGAFLYSAPQALFALPLVVFLGPLLGGYRLVVLTATGVTLVVAAATRLSAAGAAVALVSDADARAVMLLVVASAGLSWLVYRPLRSVLGWAWNSYLEEARKTEAVRDRQAELARMSKSLAEACERLEQLNLALLEARRAADEARSLKDEFVVAISHELRTPLNLIIGFSEMIVNAPASDGDGAAVFRSDVETIYRNACHLSALVEDVLDLGQLDAPRFALKKEWSALAPIVEEAVSAVQPLYAKARLGLSVELPADLPELYVDPVRIRQVITNLLTNAVRYTDEGGVRVTAHQEGNDVVVSVSDSGVGIAPEDLPYVFETYRQAGQRNRRGGFGLGLTISKRFVEMHAGAMRVTSEPGQGTTFSFALPTMDNVAAASAPRDWARLERHYLQSQRERTVLLLDADPEPARVFQRYLDEYRVLVATCADEAERFARSESIRALIVTGPDVGSDDAAVRAVQQHHPHVPVLRCALRTVDHAGRELGVAAFLVKPVSPKKLGETLRRLKLRPRRVLVIEDEPAMAHLLGRMLRDVAPRCRIWTATDALEGFSLAADRRPDLVLLDLLMPGVDGHTFLRWLRDDPALCRLPVVIVSAASEEGHDFVTGESLEIRRGDGMSVAELMRTVRGTLDGLLPRLDGYVAARS